MHSSSESVLIAAARFGAAAVGEGVTPRCGRADDAGASCSAATGGETCPRIRSSGACSCAILSASTRSASAAACSAAIFSALTRAASAAACSAAILSASIRAASAAACSAAVLSASIRAASAAPARRRSTRFARGSLHLPGPELHLVDVAPRRRRRRERAAPPAARLGLVAPQELLERAPQVARDPRGAASRPARARAVGRSRAAARCAQRAAGRAPRGCARARATRPRARRRARSPARRGTRSSPSSTACAPPRASRARRRAPRARPRPPRGARARPRRRRAAPRGRPTTRGSRPPTPRAPRRAAPRAGAAPPTLDARGVRALAHALDRARQGRDRNPEGGRRRRGGRRDAPAGLWSGLCGGVRARRALERAVRRELRARRALERAVRRELRARRALERAVRRELRARRTLILRRSDPHAHGAGTASRRADEAGDSGVLELRVGLRRAVRRGEKEIWLARIARVRHGREPVQGKRRRVHGHENFARAVRRVLRGNQSR